ncbi:hypothetical protein HAZT_HAZT007422 [Hyalella azteca]|uniref:ATP-dependent DNA helicase n=1 Tax=Hyalella azteca TaxID=294128 RepID=A0A6A0GV99_HYAAZ|nr:hypothetical protein HAZT_HAZT007422 [Hyalella azteca]
MENFGCRFLDCVNCRVCPDNRAILESDPKILKYYPNPLVSIEDDEGLVHMSPHERNLLEQADVEDCTLFDIANLTNTPVTDSLIKVRPTTTTRSGKTGAEIEVRPTTTTRSGKTGAGHLLKSHMKRARIPDVATASPVSSASSKRLDSPCSSNISVANDSSAVEVSIDKRQGDSSPSSLDISVANHSDESSLSSVMEVTVAASSKPVLENRQEESSSSLEISFDNSSENSASSIDVTVDEGRMVAEVQDTNSSEAARGPDSPSVSSSSDEDELPCSARDLSKARKLMHKKVENFNYALSRHKKLLNKDDVYHFTIIASWPGGYGTSNRGRAGGLRLDTPKPTRDCGMLCAGNRMREFFIAEVMDNTASEFDYTEATVNQSVRTGTYVDIGDATHLFKTFSRRMAGDEARGVREGRLERVNHEYYWKFIHPADERGLKRFEVLYFRRRNRHVMYGDRASRQSRGLASLEDHFLVRLSDSQALTSHDPGYIGYVFDVLLNRCLQVNTCTTAMRKGLDHIVRPGVGYENRRPDSMVDQIDSKREVKRWVKHFFKIILLSPDKPLGDVEFYWMRYEFQDKGALGNKPHVHAGITLKEGSDLNTKLERIANKVCDVRMTPSYMSKYVSGVDEKRDIVLTTNKDAPDVLNVEAHPFLRLPYIRMNVDFVEVSTEPPEYRRAIYKRSGRPQKFVHEDGSLMVSDLAWSIPLGTYRSIKGNAVKKLSAIESNFRVNFEDALAAWVCLLFPMLMLCVPGQAVLYNPQLRRIDGQSEDSVREQVKVFPLLVGPPGAGKTHILLTAFVYALSKGLKTNVVAVTSERARMLGGEYIHLLFGIDVNKCVLETPNITADKCLLKLSRNLVRMAFLKRLDVLIFEEIGLLPLNLFVVLDIVLRLIRDNPVPFGGILMIAYGDPRQLPPVEGCSIWLSAQLVTVFSVLSLHHYVRSRLDVELQLVISLIRKSVLSEDEIASVLNVISVQIFVPSWDHVPDDVIRVVSKRVAEREAVERYLLLKTNTPGLEHKTYVSEDTVESAAGTWVVADGRVSAQLDRQLPEARELTLFVGAVMRVTFNNVQVRRDLPRFSQGQLVVITQLMDDNLPLNLQRITGRLMLAVVDTLLAVEELLRIDDSRAAHVDHLLSQLDVLHDSPRVISPEVPFLQPSVCEVPSLEAGFVYLLEWSVPQNSLPDQAIATNLVVALPPSSRSDSSCVRVVPELVLGGVSSRVREVLSLSEASDLALALTRSVELRKGPGPPEFTRQELASRVSGVIEQAGSSGACLDRPEWRLPLRHFGPARSSKSDSD